LLLNAFQRSVITSEGMTEVPSLTEGQCYEILRRLRWPSGIVCPGCGSQRVTTHSKFAATPRRRYLCLGCRRTFTDLTGTPFWRTNLPLRSWVFYLRLRTTGQSTAALAKALGVKWDTVAYMHRRLGLPRGWPVLATQLRQTLERAEDEQA